MTERYILGEGYGVGRGILSDGANKGAFAWVGLTTTPGGTVACPLVFPDTSLIVNSVVQEPNRRRKFRLVLEVMHPGPAPEKGPP